MDIVEKDFPKDSRINANNCRVMARSRENAQNGAKSLGQAACPVSEAKRGARFVTRSHGSQDSKTEKSFHHIDE